MGKGGVKMRKKVFYGWSLAVAAVLIGCGFTEDAPAFSAQINSSFFHTIMTIEF